MHKFYQRVIIIILLAFLALTSMLVFQFINTEKVVAVNSQKAEVRCPLEGKSTPEKFSLQGKIYYEQGHFDISIDCWKKAVSAYRNLGNKNEEISSLINQAQAEQAIGLYPRACYTILPIYYQKKEDKDIDCTSLPQNQEERKKFIDSLEKSLITKEENIGKTKIAGLRILGNIFRGLGELDLSNMTLLLSLKKTQPKEQATILLDLGNIRRALSNKQQDLYNLSREDKSIVCAIVNSYLANEAYQQVLANINTTTSRETQLQAKLNQLSLILDLKDWRTKLNKPAKVRIAQSTSEDILVKLSQKNIDAFRIRVATCLREINNNYSAISERKDNSSNYSSYELVKNFWQSLDTNAFIQPQYIDNLQKQIEQKKSQTRTDLFIKLNFAKSLIRLNNLNTISNTENFLKKIIKEAEDIRDSKAKSYAYGYLGELYEKVQKWDLAEKNTQQALYIAQSVSSAQDIEYIWESQLGRIYKSQLPPRTQTQTKELQQESLKNYNLSAAREMYKRAYLTLQSLRRELALGNPDSQLSFQNDIETIYRDYIDLLLWDKEPAPEYLANAREVIASLQAVELENFLRLSCPEYNLTEVDKIIDEKTTETAFLYPIVLEDRIEVIIKLPETNQQKQNNKKTSTSLLHYSSPIDIENQSKEFGINLEEYTLDAFVRKFQRDLEEEYTFEDVRKEGQLMYKLLLSGAEKYLTGINTLVFALDTNLRNIPLAALVMDYQQEKPKYLIDKYAIALAPRLDIPKPISLKGKELKVLAVGLESANPEQDGLKFPQLNYIKQELKAINSPQFKFSVSELINDEFKIHAFKEKLNKSTFQILHLATHGEFSSSAEKTFLLAYDNPIFVKEVGDLFRTQAQKQPEPIEMLVLSACETAAGDKRATLGISGVAVRAGARSAVASLWTLDDKISADFTYIFYNQFINIEQQKQTTAKRAKALQQAQITLKEIPGREHPRYWAPYILLGNWL